MCAKNRLGEITDCVVAESRKIFGSKLNSVILFGSYARGDYDGESDVDILILVDLPMQEIAKQRTSIDTLCGDLLWKYGIVVSAIEKDTETYLRYASVLPFYKNIQREGVRIA